MGMCLSLIRKGPHIVVLTCDNSSFEYTTDSAFRGSGSRSAEITNDVRVS